MNRKDVESLLETSGLIRCSNEEYRSGQRGIIVIGERMPFVVGFHVVEINDQKPCICAGVKPYPLSVHCLIPVSNGNALNFVERNLVLEAVRELPRPCRIMAFYMLRHFQPAAVR